MFHWLQGNGFGRRLFQYKFYSSITAAGQPLKGYFLVHHLINSLGFSEQEAISSIKKVTLWKSSTKDPNLVLNFLRKLGLDKTQIKTLVSTYPKLLLYDVDKTLQPKIRVLQDLGIAGSDLIKVLMNFKRFLGTGLNSQIIPSIEFLRNSLGSDEKVAKAIVRYGLLLNAGAHHAIAKNVEVLQKIGFSKEDISKFILENPKLIIAKLGRLKEILYMVENDFGIPRYSKMFYYGVMSASITKSVMDEKFRVFRSFGWSDATIYGMIRSYPKILGTSEDKMKIAGKFFMQELGYTPDYLASHPAVFKYSLEKRVKPRNDILKILNEKRLNKKKKHLYNILCMTEEKFVDEYLLPHKDEIPEVYNRYLKIVGSEKIGKL